MNNPTRRPVLIAADQADAAEAAAFAGFGPDTATPIPVKDDPKTLIARSRAHAQVVLDGLTQQKAHAEAAIARAEKLRQERIALATERHDEALATAKNEYDAEMASIEADLHQITACKEGFDLLVGVLNKAAT